MNSVIESLSTQPRHVHDCDLCKFLGCFDKYDLYYCGTKYPTVIARCSSSGSDYCSGLVFGELGMLKPLVEARALAIKAGYLEDKIIKAKPEDVEDIKRRKLYHESILGQ